MKNKDCNVNKCVILRFSSIQGRPVAYKKICNLQLKQIIFTDGQHNGVNVVNDHGLSRFGLTNFIFHELKPQ